MYLQVGVPEYPWSDSCDCSGITSGTGGVCVLRFSGLWSSPGRVYLQCQPGLVKSYIEVYQCSLKGLMKQGLLCI